MDFANIPPIEDVEQTGVRRSLLEDLALKTFYLMGEVALREMAAQMRVGLGIVRELFDALRKDLFVEIKGMAGGDFRVTTTDKGRERALALLAQNQYAGATPVSLKDYVGRVRQQSVRDFNVRPEDMAQAFEHLVLSEPMLKQLGTALVSGTSLLLYGPTGTGKTVIAEAMPRVYHDRVWIPHAVEVDGQIIVVFDPLIHESIPDPLHTPHDERWVMCKRPRVLVGAELTFELLDLQYNPATKFYAAPVQMKANNGVLIVDNFGRQRVRPEDLLSRWILPLDRRIDFLTLAGGRKMEIPFDLFVIFATGSEPSELADPAFLRRIPNKIKVSPMKKGQFKEVFQRVCQEYGMGCDPEVVDYLIELLEKEYRQPLRASYPRDLLNQIRWSAQYEGSSPQATRETVLEACRDYFPPAS